MGIVLFPSSKVHVTLCLMPYWSEVHRTICSIYDPAIDPGSCHSEGTVSDALISFRIFTLAQHATQPVVWCSIAYKSCLTTERAPADGDVRLQAGHVAQCSVPPPRTPSLPAINTSNRPGATQQPTRRSSPAPHSIAESKLGLHSITRLTSDLTLSLAGSC